MRSSFAEAQPIKRRLRPDGRQSCQESRRRTNELARLQSHETRNQPRQGEILVTERIVNERGVCVKQQDSTGIQPKARGQTSRSTVSQVTSGG